MNDGRRTALFSVEYEPFSPDDDLLYSFEEKLREHGFEPEVCPMQDGRPAVNWKRPENKEQPK